MSMSTLLARQRAQRGGHRRLQRVLGIVAIAKDRQAVAVELLMVALEDLLEGALRRRVRPAG